MSKRNILKKNWFELQTELKERWPDLTQSDLDYINGDEEKLLEIVMKRRHITEEEARLDVRFFLNTLPPQQKLA
ncbi:MAG: CsbD family protein [Acidobacteria bacterium]|nr:CsbD family protein [Acidobacteriota bacterium]